MLIASIILLSVMVYRSWGDRTALLVDWWLFESEAVRADGVQSSLDQEILDQLFDTVWFSTDDFWEAYETALQAHDQFLKLNIAESLFAQTNDTRVIPVLVLLSLQHHSLAHAAQYIEREMLDNSEFVQAVWPKVLLRILFNSSLYDEFWLDMLKDFVDSMKQAWLILQEDMDFYYSLIALLRDDMFHFDYYTNRLLSTDLYAWRYEAMQYTKTRAEQFTYVPEYYQLWLVWIELFAAGWYQPALTIGNMLNTFNPSYLLWRQLQAYSSLFMGDWKVAVRHFERIRMHHNDDIYTLLQAISLYYDEALEESVLLLRQISDRSIVLDARRYLLLAFKELNNQQWVTNTISSMLWYELSPFDYFTVFDVLFFDKQQTVAFSDTTQQLAEKLLQQCRTDLSQSHWFVCLYWTAWMLYASQQYQRALPVMESLLRWYPTSAVLERIGDIYYALDDLESAKKSYIQAFSATNDSNELLFLRQRITSLLAL